MSDLAPEQQFAGHRIEAELGRGGMGIVYLARHIALDRLRAIKVLAPELAADATFATRFRRESRLAASIEHPNVVVIHHAGEEEGRLYLVMQYVEGSDLHAALRSGPLPTERTLSLLGGVGAALDAAHGHGLIHRDVKPANVLIGSAAGGERAYLTDFGISKLARIEDEGAELTAERGLTSTGAVLGTTDYVSPEQIEGEELTPRADVYALACVAFHAFAGRPPFARPTAIATLMAHARAERPVASDVESEIPGAIDEVLARGMAIDPAERPASAGELAEQLVVAGGGERRRSGRVAAGAVREEPPPTAPQPRVQEPGPTEALAGPGGSRRRLLPAALGLLAVAVIAAAVVALAGGGEDDPAAGNDGGADTAAGAGQAGGGDDPKPRVLEPVARILVGAEPIGIAVGADRVWAASRVAGEVARIDPQNNQPDGAPIPVEGAKSVAVGLGAVWAISKTAVSRIDPGTGAQVAIAGDFVDLQDVTVDENFVWVTDAGVPGRAEAGPGRLLRINADSNAVDGDASAGLDPRSVASDGEFVWVTNAEQGTVTKVAAANAGKELDIDAGARPTNVAVGAGSVWVTDFSAAELLRIDPKTDRVVGDPVPVGGARPRGVAVGFGSVWVASGAAGRVFAFDPKTLEPRPDVRRVGANPADIAVGENGVWTPDFDDDRVTRSKPRP